MTLRIGGACLNQTPMDWAGNVSRINMAIELAKKDQIKILCLPELCITGYGCEDQFLTEWLPATALSKLNDIVPNTKGILVVVGLPMRLNGRVYDVAAILAEQEILGFYAKQKLADEGVHYEPRWFTPWEAGKVSEIVINRKTYPFGHITVEYVGIKVGFEVCEDAWRVDRPGLLEVNQGVQLFLNPSGSHFAFGKAAFREELVRKSAETLQAVYLYTNLLGNEAGRMIYDGDILVAQNSEIIARNRRLSFQDVNVLGCTVDFDFADQSERVVKPDFSSQNEEFSRAASLALFDYLRKSKSKGFVLSLSGGADSSSIAVLVAEAVRNGLNELGFDAFQKKIGIKLENGPAKEIVGQLFHTAYQGTANSSDATYLSAKTLAESLGANFHQWSIDGVVGTYSKIIEGVIGRPLNWEQDDLAMQNIQARARSPIIWMLTNIHRCLLLSTSNRSEGDVGYATMDGDTSGSISPIAAVSKEFILQWLKFAETELGYNGLNRVNNLTPTAELRPLERNQTDEDDLMPYPVLAAIERAAIRDRQSPEQVFQHLESDYPDALLLKKWITKFYRLWAINQWKRERIAPSFHLDDFNVDPRTWCRFPILSSGFEEELQKLNHGTGS